MSFRFLLTKKNKTHLPITVFKRAEFDEWFIKQTKTIQTIAKEIGFDGKQGQLFVIRNDHGRATSLFYISGQDVSYAQGSELYDSVLKQFSEIFLKNSSFEILSETLSSNEIERLCIGWGWSYYRYEKYKKEKKISKPCLFLSAKGLNKKRIQSFTSAVFLLRDLINTPSNDMGPDELEKEAELLCKHLNGTIEVIRDKKLISNNFPMIFAVGKGSTRRPRLIDMTFGNSKGSKVTIVGKGVCFDTGGLDIKPSQNMLTMKKDMGGAAHAMALAQLIVDAKLPISLRILLPVVENSISGDSFRPSDVLSTRKGISVEVGNTDAEGRLILADAISYACEDKPDLLIDFATLTGAARVALGPDLPAVFSNNEDTLFELMNLSKKIEIADPIWPLPLWGSYRKDMSSSVADISSTGTGTAGAINAALFLREFVDESIEWLHLDIFAWENTGKTGKPKGGADTGLRAVFALLEQRYAKKI